MIINPDTEFIDDIFSNDILNNVIKKVYPNLNFHHQNILNTRLIDIIQTIAIKFLFDPKNRNVYRQQFIQNNYQDTIALLNLLLPYINDTQDKSNIYDLNDIYVKKRKQSDNINTTSPSYLYSNLQYSRCNRDNDTLTEVAFKTAHIDQNVFLLKNTIQSIANKMFVNLIDVKPVPYVNTNNNIELTSVIKHTHYAITNGSLHEWDIGNPNDVQGQLYSGIPISDIYNTFVNGLFVDIKDIKWLIYDVYIDSDIPFPYFIMIQKILSLEPALDFQLWNQLTDQERDTFSQSWYNLVNSKISKSSTLSNDILFTILRTIIFFFSKYGFNKSKAVSDGFIISPIILNKKEPENDKEEEEEDDKDILELKIDEAIKSAFTLKPQYIYDFIVDQFVKLNGTYYGVIFRGYDNTLQKMLNYETAYNNQLLIIAEYGGIYITSKNLYNFAKSLSHTTIKGKYIFMGNNWNSLTPDNKNEILNRITAKKSDESTLLKWFNISRYILRLDRSLKKSLYEYHLAVHDYIINNMAAIVGNIMSYKGIFSHFTPNSIITDSIYHPKNDVEKVIYIQEKLNEQMSEDKNMWNNCHYFANNELYSNMGPYYVNTQNKKVKEINYYEYMTTKQTWYTTYAMNWVSQLSFFHRYLNNRIMYVTGSTGVGKSTQIPKLLLYALKAIDYNEQGQIICTQPRIPPTEGNAFRISNELGTPIKQYDSRFNKEMVQNNYTVQYKHQFKQHSGGNKLLSLKIVTDGTLYLELQNPLLKKRKYVNNEYVYNVKNMYDIIIVDEAHEHNANMDMILTLMKNALMYNSSIKLVIISATMDDDEPIYRRYYRNINDNLMYPFNFTLEQHNLDRINIDRRLHISPPGQTTRFKIDEHYVPNNDPHDIVMKIVNTTSNGDILLFHSGEADIKKSVELLNTKLPSNVIALPYFSNMHSDKKQEIENIEFRKKNITLAHDADYNYFTFPTEGNTRTVSSGTYTRVIIIATNIAEASITIGSLKYVIETGKQKIGLFNPITRKTELRETPISESSRLQRKGRVGRVAAGTVYYLYEKDSMLNNKISYNISIQDITDSMFTLLRTTYEDNKVIINHNNISNLSKIDANVKDVVKQQYYVNDTFITYRGNDGMYDYTNNNYSLNVYPTGLSYETLLDEEGHFYIIHPEELNIKRNIVGKIVDIIEGDNIKNNNQIIKSDKMYGFFHILQERLCVLYNGIKIIKTDYGNYLYKIKEEMKLENVNHLIMYIFSRQYGVHDDIIKVLALIEMFQTSKTSINMWASKYTNERGKMRTNLEKLKHLYGNCKGDIYGLLNCINKFFESNNILQKIPTNDTTKNMLDKKKKYRDFQKGLINDIDSDTYEQFKMLELNNRLANSDLLSKYELLELAKSDIDKTLLYSDIETNENKIKNWCKYNYVDYITFNTFLKSYIKILTMFYKKEKKAYDINIDEKNMDIEFTWFDTVLHKFKQTHFDKNTAINMSLLHAYGINVCKNIIGSDLYVNIYNPVPEYIYTIKKIHPNINVYDTLLTNNCISDYVLYISIDNNTDSIYVLQSINVELIQQATLFTYIPLKLKKMLNKDYHTKMIEQVLETIDTEKKKKIIHNYIKTIHKIYSDLINTYDKNIWSKLLLLCNSDKHILKLCVNNINEQQNMNTIQTGGTKKQHIYNGIVKLCL